MGRTRASTRARGSCQEIRSPYRVSISEILRRERATSASCRSFNIGVSVSGAGRLATRRAARAGQRPIGIDLGKKTVLNFSWFETGVRAFDLERSTARYGGERRAFATPIDRDQISSRPLENELLETEIRCLFLKRREYRHLSDSGTLRRDRGLALRRAPAHSSRRLAIFRIPFWCLRVGVDW